MKLPIFIFSAFLIVSFLALLDHPPGLSIGVSFGNSSSKHVIDISKASGIVDLSEVLLHGDKMNNWPASVADMKDSKACIIPTALKANYRFPFHNY